jgi:SAM-dependent methyltransferase
VVAEAFRVLRPGGVIGIADADYAGSIAGPLNAGVERSHRLVIDLRLARQGSPLVGRELGVLLHRSGFVDVEQGARAEVVSGTTAADVAKGQAAYFAAPELGAYALERKLATVEELEAISAGWADWGATPGATWARFTCTATARRP